jgi:hypothetical protein
MNARIIGRSGHLVGVHVVDADGNDHEISIDEADGTVAVHTTDAYSADLDSRAPEVTELLRQAQRYAKHAFDRELVRSTRPAIHTPERIEAVRDAVASQSTDAFASSFGRLHDQLLSHAVADARRPVDLPSDVVDPDAVLYRQGVALDDGDVDAVSGIEVVYRDATAIRRRARDGDRLDGAADARIELQPTQAGDGEPPHDLASFRGTLTHHLTCQLRDCFVRMGVDPPEDARVCGPGKHAATVCYRTLETYPDYHDADAAVF